MHAGMRRVPVERARHAKRLGHVQVLARPDNENGNETTTTTQLRATSTAGSSQAPPAVIPTIRPSSSALTSSLSATPSSSNTIPSTSSVVLTTDAQLPTTPAPPSSTIISPAVLTSTSSTPSSTSAPHPVATTSSGLSGGAIAGIIAGAVVVGTALIVFIVRKTYLRRRERQHVSWDGAPGLGAGILDEPKPIPDTSERPDSFTGAANTPKRIVPLSPFEGHGQSMYYTPASPTHMQPSTIPTYVVPMPPPASYNNPVPVTAYPPRPAPSAYSSGNPSIYPVAPVATGAGVSSALSSVHPQPAPMEAIVRCTFVPNLPDELSITTGERIFVIEQYDDGWDLCTNLKGERGMVPRECLEHVPADQPDIGWRNARRTSSLNPDGRRS